MNYREELALIEKSMLDAYSLYAVNPPKEIIQKGEYDLVTEIDKSIELYISGEIKREFPNDHILGEELTSAAKIKDRTWTIDPIDGTCNMASGMKLFGMQCSLIDKGEIVLAYIYLPLYGESLYAIINEGCYVNGKQVSINRVHAMNNAIISFGDYSHGNNGVTAKKQHTMIGLIYENIAKIRMFGAACVDFSFVVQGRTDGTVIFTKNLWDIAPGILLCKEAGATVLDLHGDEYQFDADGVIVGASREIAEYLCRSYKEAQT